MFNLRKPSCNDCLELHNFDEKRWAFVGDDTKRELPLTFFRDHPEWDLERPVSVTLQHRELQKVVNNSIVVLTLRLHRNPRFYFVCLLVPFATIYTLSFFVFFIPVQSAERLSFAITLFLAQTLNFTTFMAIFPENSRNVPYMGYFACVISFQMAFLSLFSILG